MSMTLDAGIVTAYGAAVRGGYEGTYTQFCADLASLAEVLNEFTNFQVTVETLAEGASATASYDSGILSLGIPKGDTGNGIESIVLNEDYTLTVTYTSGTTWTSGSIRGATGATPQLSIGTVTTGAAGSSAAVTITGTTDAPVLNFTIPKGDTGEVAAEVIAEDFDSTAAYSAGDYVWYDDALWKFNADHAAGAWTGTDADEVSVSDELGALSSALSDLTVEETLLAENIPNTTQTVTFDSDTGKPTTITHVRSSTTVRTDSFTWGSGTVTETRTLADGTYITLTTNLTTLVTVISDIQEGT